MELTAKIPSEKWMRRPKPGKYPLLVDFDTRRVIGFATILADGETVLLDLDERGETYVDKHGLRAPLQVSVGYKKNMEPVESTISLVNPSPGEPTARPAK